jgi:predicted nucleic acid-binding protein
MTSGIVCIDANFVVGLLVGERLDSPFDRLWIQWQDAGYTVVAPALIYYEVSNVFHRLTVARQLLPQEADQSLNEAFNLNITLYSDLELHQQALYLARNLRLPATYDAHYLALAQRLECEFWTADRRLVNSVQTTLPWVNLVS